MSSLPVRGPAVRSLDLPLPPGRMPLVRAGRPLKRWRYVAVYGPDLMLCAGAARVAGLAQRWWAVATADGSLYEGGRGVDLSHGRVRVPGVIDLAVDEGAGVEVVSPHGRSYIWTRKQAALAVRGHVRAGEREWRVDGPLGFIDESAGYHARHTAWRWSAGIGRATGGEAVAWNLVDGVHDGASASERTVWVDGEPHEVGPAGSRPTCRAWASFVSASGPPARTARTASSFAATTASPSARFPGRCRAASSWNAATASWSGTTCVGEGEQGGELGLEDRPQGRGPAPAGVAGEQSIQG